MNKIRHAIIIFFTVGFLQAMEESNQKFEHDEGDIMASEHQSETSDDWETFINLLLSHEVDNSAFSFPLQSPNHSSFPMSLELDGVVVHDSQGPQEIHESNIFPLKTSANSSKKLFKDRAQAPILKSKKDFKDKKQKIVEISKVHKKKCQDCNLTIAQRLKENHALFHDEKTPEELKCSPCKLGFRAKHGVGSHMTRIHGIGIAKKKSPTTKIYVTCKQCNKVVYCQIYRNHMLFHDSETPDSLKCVACELGHTTDKAFERHYNSYHNNRYNCINCGLTMTKNKLTAHENFHDPKIPKELKCFQCFLGYKKEKMHEHHMDTVHGHNAAMNK